MILDVLALFDNKVLATNAAGIWVSGATTPSTSSYDTIAAGGAGVSGNSSTVTGSGGGGTGVSAVPAPLGPPGTGPLGAPLLHDIGRGRPIFLYSQIGVANTAGGTSVQENFVSDAAAILTTANNIVLSTPVVALATMVLGYHFPWKTVPGKVTKQFIGMSYTVVGVFTGTANFTSGLAFFLDGHADVLGGAP